MATNYLSASLLSKNYQNMLDADNRENEKQIKFAFESGGYLISVSSRPNV